MKFNDFATDKNAEEEGRWFPMGPTSRIKLRSFSSQSSKDCRRELERPYATILRIKGALPDDIAEELAIVQMSSVIVVDWEGFIDEDEDGNEVNVPYSKKEAESRIRQYTKFRDFIAGIVISDDSFKPEARKDAEKNS